MKIPVPALFRKIWFRRTTGTVAAIGAIAITYALPYHKPEDDWFVSIEECPAWVFGFPRGWSDITAPTVSPAWKPKTLNLNDWLLRKEGDKLVLQFTDTSDWGLKLYQSPVIHADTNGTATLSDGTVVTLQEATLSLYEKTHRFAVNDGRIARLPVPSDRSISPPGLGICMNSSTPLRVLFASGIYDMAGSPSEFHFYSSQMEDQKNVIYFTTSFYMYYDTPLKFCILVNHGEPQHLTIPANAGAVSTGRWGSVYYLGEMSGIRKNEIAPQNVIMKIHVARIDDNSRETRECVFVTDSMPDETRRDTDKIKIILANGREFIDIQAHIVQSFGDGYIMFYTLPEEAGDVPVKSFVFTRYSEMSRVVFKIPSLIDFFPENKGIKNRFDVKIPKWGKHEMHPFYVSQLFRGGLGLDPYSLDRRTSVKAWRVETEYLHLNKTQFDFYGKTFREALVEYLQANDNSKPEDVVLDMNYGQLYIKIPLQARLLLWWEEPTLKRWPWSDPGPQ